MHLSRSACKNLQKPNQVTEPTVAGPQEKPEIQQDKNYIDETSDICINYESGMLQVINKDNECFDDIFLTSDDDSEDVFEENSEEGSEDYSEDGSETDYDDNDSVYFTPEEALENAPEEQDSDNGNDYDITEIEGGGGKFDLIRMLSWVRSTIVFAIFYYGCMEHCSFSGSCPDIYGNLNAMLMYFKQQNTTITFIQRNTLSSLGLHINIFLVCLVLFLRRCLVKTP